MKASECLKDGAPLPESMGCAMSSAGTIHVPGEVVTSQENRPKSNGARKWKNIAHAVMKPTRADQLHRKNFTERIKLEARMHSALNEFMFFMIFMATYIATVFTYDPLLQISRIHQGLRARFQTSTLEEVRTEDQVMAYIKTFVDTSYTLASALIDANTLDSIDVSRCFSPDVNDICHLKYWQLHLDKSHPNYVNVAALQNDQLGKDNHRPSIWDCDQPAESRKANCMDRDDPSNVDSTVERVFGLTPEDPIIMQTRQVHSSQGVVPLTPVVWQVRAKEVPCKGFGDRYNDEVLGAGTCSAHQPCNPRSVTEFKSATPASRTKREQSIFLSYGSAAFHCVDRSQYADSFADKSWSPWAKYEDLVSGVDTAKVQFHGQPIFYKFVPDVAYLQAPTFGAIEIHAEECSTQAVTCTAGKAVAGCQDPLINDSHPMWSATEDAYSSDCSLRQKWSDKYLNEKEEDWTSLRRNTWFTIETTALTVAALVITPQPADVVDIITLVRVTFDVDQGGFIQGRVIITSESETPTKWIILASVTALVAFSYMVWFSLRLRLVLLEVSVDQTEEEHCAQPRASVTLEDESELQGVGNLSLAPLLVLDIIIALSAGAQTVTLMVVDRLPPHVADDLIKAFYKNSQAQYFWTFLDIIDYHQRLEVLKVFGCCVSLAFLCRLCMFMSMHPRMALLVKTIAAAADDTVHFFVYFLLVSVVFAFLATWAFSAEDANFESFSATFWTQLKMFTGDIDFVDSRNSSFLWVSYLSTYIFIVFICLMNFLLAIVVNGYTAVQANLSEMVVDQNFVADLLALCHQVFISRYNSWPSPACMWHYLRQARQKLAAVDEVEMPAVTGEELYEKVRTHDGLRRFASVKSAQAYVNAYARKVKWQGEYPIRESRAAKLFQRNRYLGEARATE